MDAELAGRARRSPLVWLAVGAGVGALVAGPLIYLPGKAAVDDLEARRVDAEGELALARGDIAELEAELSVLEDAVSGLEDQTGVLEDQLALVAAAKARLEDVNAAALAESSDLEALAGLYFTLVGRLRSCIDELSAANADLRARASGRPPGEGSEAADRSCEEAELLAGKVDEAVRDWLGDLP